jgi:soluble lytic murein transglycosylase-like protein
VLSSIIRCLVAPMFVVAALTQPASAADERVSLDALIAQHASANGVPVSLVRRVIMRESRYNARAITGGNYGLMQIRLGTARALGYRGSAAGLLDPATNMTYAVRYLAGAYRAAGGNESRAMALYQSGYYTSRHRRRSI